MLRTALSDELDTASQQRTFDVLCCWEFLDFFAVAEVHTSRRVVLWLQTVYLHPGDGLRQIPAPENTSRNKAGEQLAAPGPQRRADEGEQVAEDKDAQDDESTATDGGNMGAITAS